MDDGSTVSVLMYRTSGPQGKVKRRVQDLRIPSSSHLDHLDHLTTRPTLDLSHNESARLAADCLLSRGLQGFRQVLQAEGEVDFLSEPEKNYILENRSRPDADDDDDKELESLSAGSVSSTSLEESTDSDCTLAEINHTNMKDVNFRDPVMNESTEVFFGSDSSMASMKDMVRHAIRKAKQDVAVVVDSFSDVELLCDVLEASRKRNVSVHLLLDHLNLGLFLSLWQDLRLNSKDFPKLSVRSVPGGTYCAKTGRKLPGQIAESFIMVDCTEVLTGSFSLCWLHWQVHRSFLVLLSGPSLLAPFHQELHRLYCSSSAVAGFVTFIPAPKAPRPRRAPRAARRNASVKQRTSYPMSRWLDTAAAVTFSRRPTEAERGKPGEAPKQRGNVPVCFQAQTRSRSQPRTLASNVHSQLAGLAIGATEVRNGRLRQCEPLQKAAQHQGRKSHQDSRSNGLSFQQKVRDMLAKPFVVAAGGGASGRWKPSPAAASQHDPATPSRQRHFLHPPRHVPELQTKLTFLPAYQPHLGSGAAPGPLGSRSQSGPRARPPFQRLPPEQTYGWSPLSWRADRGRAMERQSSLSSRHGAGRPAWRPLPRSNSMPERRTAGLRTGGRLTHTLDD